MRHHRHVLCALVCAALLPAAGCRSYSARPLIRNDIKSVCVKQFDNVTWRHGYERDLTLAVVQEIRRLTSLRIASPEDADSVLTGTITDVEERVNTKTLGDVIIQKRISLTVLVQWKDNRTGLDLQPPQSITESVRLALPLGEPLTTRAFREIAQRIV